MGTEFSVRLQRQQSGSQDRESEQNQNTGQQNVPYEDRQYVFC